jgi:peptide-methionine (S)-S-oxide reductase
MARATFAAGCFWGVEETFRHVPGVERTRVGYIGGRTENPTYRDVCSHTTGHAEAVEVTYNPDVVSYPHLLKVFWSSHDPTQVNRQGPDVGDNYRSAIFTHDQKQEAAARGSRNAEQANHKRPIATEIVPAPEFWEAEEYHQQYHEKNSGVACGIGGWLIPAGGKRDSISAHDTGSERLQGDR